MTSNEIKDTAEQLKHNGEQEQEELDLFDNFSASIRKIASKRWFNGVIAFIFIATMAFKTSPIYLDFSSKLTECAVASCGVDYDYFTNIMEGIESIAKAYELNQKNDDINDQTIAFKEDLPSIRGDPPATRPIVEGVEICFIENFENNNNDDNRNDER